MQKVDAIVFIKKDSERLPGKNFLSFNGQTLFTVILETLNQHPLIDKILVNSDSEDALNYVENDVAKGVAIQRPDKLRGQRISANDLIAHDLSFSGNQHFFETHATNPLLTPHTISAAIEKYFASLPTYDSLFSVTKIQSRFFDASGTPINHAKGELLRLQDLAPVFMENSSFFIFSADSFVQSGNNRIGLRPQPFPVSPIEGADIDYKDDFILAELLHRNRHLFPHIFKDLT